MPEPSTLVSYGDEPDALRHGESAERGWVSVDGAEHAVTMVHSIFRDGTYVIAYSRWIDGKIHEKRSAVYSTFIAASAAFHAIGPGIHPPRLLTERETQEP
jgi:hypothetical protein